MKNYFIILSVFCLALSFATVTLARDPVVDLLVRKGLVSEDDIAALEGEKTSVLSGSSSMEIGGYVQAQYWMYDDDAGIDDTFKMRRVYLYFKGYVTPQWGVVFSYDFVPEVLVDAYLTYEYSPQINICAGQFLLPYSLEQMTSSAMVDTIERAMVSNTLADHRDIGVKVHGYFMENMFGYGLAIVNGNGINATDDNDKKDIIAQINLRPFCRGEGPLCGLLLSGAVQFGDTPRTGTVVDPVTGVSTDVPLGNETRTRWIGTVQWKYQNIKLQGEYLSEELEDTDVKADGFYVVGTYDIDVGGMILQPVVKYEQFDPNTDVSDDETTITTLGVNFFPAKKTKLSVNYRIKDETPDTDNNELIAQWQHIF